MKRRSITIIGWTLTAAATYAAVFVLPYRFPLREPVLSDTWIAGANNQVAAIGLAFVSIVVTLLCWYRTQDSDAEAPLRTFDRRYLYAGIVLTILWTTALGRAVAKAHIYWGDEGYFLHQLRTGLLFHKQLYTDFEFAYGPLLYLWPAACIRLLAPLGFSFDAAYLVALAVLQSAGLTLAFYTLSGLPMRRSYRELAFGLITFATCNSLLGLNYSVFRFILPFALVIFLSRQRTMAQAAAVALIGELACLATSPELGLAFGGAALAYAIFRATQAGPHWLATTLAPLAGAGLFYAIAGPAYFFTLRNMAKGGYNMLLSPTPPIVGLLLAAIVLAPLAVAQHLRRHRPDGMILAFYVAALGMLPAALGRSDPIHTFFDGIGLYLLALVAISHAPNTWRRVGVVAAGLLIVFSAAWNLRQYVSRLTLILRPHAVQEDWGFDEAELLRAIGSAKISAPILAPQHVLDDLTRSGQYVPDYFCGWVGVWDRASEERKIADMRRTEFALVAFNDVPDLTLARYADVLRMRRLGFATHPLEPEFFRGALLAAELRAHWILVQRFGDYALYRQRS